MTPTLKRIHKRNVLTSQVSQGLNIKTSIEEPVIGRQTERLSLFLLQQKQGVIPVVIGVGSGVDKSSLQKLSYKEHSDYQIFVDDVNKLKPEAVLGAICKGTFLDSDDLPACLPASLLNYFCLVSSVLISS